METQILIMKIGIQAMRTQICTMEIEIFYNGNTMSIKETEILIIKIEISLIKVKRVIKGTELSVIETEFREQEKQKF